MTERQDYLCFVREAELKKLYASDKRTAKFSLCGVEGGSYELVTEPGDNCDLLYEAWSRGVRVLINARAAYMYGRDAKLLVDIGRVSIAAPPKGAEVV